MYDNHWTSPWLLVASLTVWPKRKGRALKIQISISLQNTTSTLPLPNISFKALLHKNYTPIAHRPNNTITDPYPLAIGCSSLFRPASYYESDSVDDRDSLPIATPAWHKPPTTPRIQHNLKTYTLTHSSRTFLWWRLTMALRHNFMSH